MTIPVSSVQTLGGAQLLAAAERLQAEEAGGDVILSLTASGDPAARERGFLPALRAAMEGAAEPPPPNFHHAWGDWPHDLFAALQPHVAAIEGLGVGVFAWPDGRREAIATDVSLQPIAYYLTQPVTFPLVAAARAMRTVVAVELHRTHAIVSELEGPRETAATEIAGPDRERLQKTGSEGLEHSERRDREIEGRYLAAVAAQVRTAAADAGAIVVIGADGLRGPFVRELGDGTPVAELNWNPEHSGRASAGAIAAAAETAIATAQAAQISAAIATGRAITDWASAIAEAKAGRLHEIWMSPAAALHRYGCGGCGSIVDGPAACAKCGASPWERLPLPELVLRHASRTGARLHFGGPTGTGIVALARY
jgi:hypothetical protein